jgi:hypothetical protein
MLRCVLHNFHGFHSYPLSHKKSFFFVPPSIHAVRNAFCIPLGTLNWDPTRNISEVSLCDQYALHTQQISRNYTLENACIGTITNKVNVFLVFVRQMISQSVIIVPAQAVYWCSDSLLWHLQYETTHGEMSMECQGHARPSQLQDCNKLSIPQSLALAGWVSQNLPLPPSCEFLENIRIEKRMKYVKY